MSNVYFGILRSNYNLSIKGDFVNVTIPKMELKLVHQQGQFIRTFTRRNLQVLLLFSYSKTIATLVNYFNCLQYVHFYASQVTTEKGSGLFSFSRADAVKAAKTLFP